MSTDSWGSIGFDRLSPRDSGTDSTSRVQERADDAGAWSEDLDINFVADTSMTIPGQSDRPDSCGVWYPQEFCDECGEPRLGVSHCQRRVCPACDTLWRRGRSEKITTRLGAAREAADSGLDKRAIHAVISPPEGEIDTLVAVQRGFRDAYSLAKDKGIRGGVCIFHGWRVTDAAKELYELAKREGNWDPDEQGKLWTWVRQHERDWRQLTYWSPHWHILGLCRDFDADDPDAQDGWVARRIRSLNSFRTTERKGFQDMFGSSMYLLSHMGFETNSSKDSIRWFGSLATTQFSPEEALSPGKWNVIQRKSEEVAMGRLDDVDEESEGGGWGSVEDDIDSCEVCGSTSFSPIWEAGYALMDQSWCQRVGREQVDRLSVAFEWAIGELDPPDELAQPRSEKAAQKLFASLLGSDSYQESGKCEEGANQGSGERGSESTDNSLPHRGSGDSELQQSSVETL